MGLINAYGVGAFMRVFTDPNADLGDWLCSVLGICA
ncbi:hypothetical protein HDC95_001898 [Microbacterium sp. AK031]|nr:hypothetical protein [Microbacterium sp. AK031]